MAKKEEEEVEGDHQQPDEAQVSTMKNLQVDFKTTAANTAGVKDEDEDISSLQNIDPVEVEKQINELNTFKKTRNNIQVNASLKKLQMTAKSNENIMPAIIQCVKNNCTLGEISDNLRLVFGEH